MTRPGNTANAHVRVQGKATTEARAERFERLWSNDDFQFLIGDTREDLVRELETHVTAGTDDDERLEREIVRTLRVLHALKRRVIVGIQKARLEESNKETVDAGGTV